MKSKISQFEFAIMEIADPEKAELHEPYSDEEVNRIRIENLKEQASQFRILGNQPPI